MTKSSAARKQKRANEASLLKRLGLKRNDVRDSVVAAHILNTYLDGRPE